MVKRTLYASKHGPDIEDEVNIIEKNRNYGWPKVTGPCNQLILLMRTLKDASLRVLALSPDGLSIIKQKTCFKNRFGRRRDLVFLHPVRFIYAPASVATGRS